MFVFILIIALSKPAQSACIWYDQEYNHNFNNVYWFQCQNGQQLQQMIQFKQEFCTTPKIVIRSISYYRQLQSSFSFTILKSTTTEFQVQLQCNSFYYVNMVEILWAALIDEKILVFNDFLISITLIDGLRSSLIPYPIQNADYEISFSITSYSGGSPNIIIEKQTNGFNLYVTGVVNSQLSGLGVQIIAGLTSQYTLYDSMSIVLCEFLATFPKAINVTFKLNMILVVVQQNIDDGYRGSLFGSIVSRSIKTDPPCPSNLNVKFQFYLYEFKYFPHYYKKIRVTQKMSFDYKLICSFDTQMLYFKEIDQTWIDNNIINSTVEYKQAIISLVYNHQCQPRRKIIVTVLRKDQQGEYNFIYPLYCHRVYNLITMYISLFSQNFGTSQLEISLTDQGVQIQEILDSGDTFQLLNIQNIIIIS